MGHVEYHFDLFRDSVKIGARVAPNVPMAQKSLWTHPIVLLGIESRVEAQFGLFGHSANLDAR
jgi:hypothetical protein